MVLVFCLLYVLSISARPGLIGSCLPGKDHSSITRFAVDRQVGVPPGKYPYFCKTTGADSVVGLGPKALGVVAILPVSRGKSLFFSSGCAYITEFDFLREGLI